MSIEATPLEDGGAPATEPIGVLLVETSRFASYGGTKRVVVQLSRALDRRRFRPHVLVYRDGPWKADLEAAGVPVGLYRAPGPYPDAGGAGRSHAEPGRSWGVEVSHGGSLQLHPARRMVSDLISWQRFFGRDLAAARRLVPQVPPGTRLVHVNHSMSGDASWFHVARMLGIPFISHEHGIWRPRTAAWRTVARRAASVLCLTQQRMDEVRASAGAGVRTDYLPNGIPIDALQPARERAEVRAALDVPERCLLVVTAGHLQEWKGQGLVVEAASRLVARGLDFVWLLCGSDVEPEFVARLRRQIAERGLDWRVRLTGERRDLPDVFAAADLAAHTSLQPEPFGMAVLEAMLQGLPVVAPREGAIPDLVRDGVDGLLVSPRDPVALADAVGALAASPPLRRVMGDAGRARVREQFDVRAQARRLEAIYARALTGSEGRAARR